MLPVDQEWNDLEKVDNNMSEIETRSGKAMDQLMIFMRELPENEKNLPYKIYMDSKIIKK